MNNKTVKSLADFKRYLSNGGAIKCLRVYGDKPRESVQARRVVDKVQRNAVRFTNGSWLYFPAAALMEFDGDIVKIYDPLYVQPESGQSFNDHSRRGQLALVYQLID